MDGRDNLTAITYQIKQSKVEEEDNNNQLVPCPLRGLQPGFSLGVCRHVVDSYHFGFFCIKLMVTKNPTKSFQYHPNIQILKNLQQRDKKSMTL